MTGLQNAGNTQFFAASLSGGEAAVGAGDRDRTDDIQLGKLTFYH
jgi:hypothetical protein